MSKFNGRNGFAVGLVLGIGVTVVLFLFGEALGEFVDCIGNGKCDGYTAKYENADPPEWWWWRWTGDLVSSSDTLAQWIMAILTIAAVILLWRTLAETNNATRASIVASNAAREANNIMRAGQRPWLKAKFFVDAIVRNGLGSFGAAKTSGDIKVQIFPTEIGYAG